MEKATHTILVDEYLSKLKPAAKEIILAIRQMMLDIDPEIAEHIKWNSVSFYYAGAMQAFDAKEYKRDMLVCNLHRGQLLLVFPTGAKIPDQLNGKNYPDGRKIITVKDSADLKVKQEQLKQLVLNWLKLVEK